MSATYNEGLEAASRWHDKQAKIYADDAAYMRQKSGEITLNPQADQARIEKYDALASEHRASAAIFRGMMAA